MITMPSETELEDVSRRGKAIYEARKAALEPQFNNQYVAIHVDTEDQAIARTSSAALRAMRQRHPADDRLYLRRIGTEPEYSLAARILASDMIEARPK